MNRISYYIAVTAVVAFVVGLSVLAPPPDFQKPKPMTRIIDFGDWQLRFETEQDVYKPGQLVRVRIFQKNLSNRTINEYRTRFGWKVHNSAGHHLWTYGSPIFIMLQRAPPRIKPMEEAELTFHGFSWNQKNYEGEQVSPGLYTIQYTDLWEPKNSVELIIRIQALDVLNTRL
ncbi:MAG: hypothetical protein OEY22_11795 [Candidatus Bathyarchaeota archaeon]|nr:hypothetical protein [Candidatus Bathyarchaeota archaeon]